jgi:hypothetical protein
MTTRKLPAWAEPGPAHPYWVRVDGRVHGWLASQDDAEALARIFREAGRDATIGGIDFSKMLTSDSKAASRPAQPKARQGTPRDSQLRAVTIVCVPGRPCEIVPASSGGRELEAG